MNSETRLVSVILVAATVASVATGQVSDPAKRATGVAAEESAVTLPNGLEVFLHATLLEASGEYREALNEYARAVELAPDVNEIRVRYAALLQELGLVDTAVAILEPAANLDWYGLRTRALALAQLATQRPELLGQAEAALRGALDSRSDDPNLDLSLAQVLQRQGRLDEAAALVGAVSAARPGNAQLVAYHASLVRGVGRLEDAAQLYRQCASNPVCRQDLVDVLIELDRPAEAGEALLDGLAEDDLDQLLRAAGLLSEGGRFEQAMTAVQRVLRVEPTSVRARTMEALLFSSLGRPAEAAAKLRALLKNDRENHDLMLSLAWNLARSGELDEARRWVNRVWEAVGHEPSSERAVACCIAAARIELVSGHPLTARDWLDRVSPPPPDRVDYVRLLGITYRRAEAWQQGAAAMLRIQPRLRGRAQAEAVAVEAEMWIRLGDPKGLERVQALFASKELPDVQLGIGVLQAAERWDGVERECGVALERFPDDRDLRFTRAAALERLGRFDEAEALFTVLAQERPDDAAAANYLGYMWADRNVRLDEALELINRAVGLDPTNSAYLDSLGWVHFRLGNLEAAEHWLRRALQLGEPDGTVLAHLGEVLAGRGAEDEARIVLRQALERGPESPERIRELLAELGD